MRPALWPFRRIVPVFLLAIVALGSGRPALGTSTEFLGLVTDIGNAISDLSLQKSRECARLAFNDVKTAFRKGRLAGGGDWTEDDEQVTLSGACADRPGVIRSNRRTSRSWRTKRPAPK